MKKSAKRVLVFGATGEIGSRIARDCVAAGYETTGVSRGKNTRHRVSLDGVDMIEGDKGDEEFVQSVLAPRGFDAVVDTVPTTEHVCFDISKAEDMLGYDPQYSTEEGLVKALEWCMEEEIF